ncbi:hypothetical protein ABTL76_20060, partial [Acinetobacter baumannii]
TRMDEFRRFIRTHDLGGKCGIANAGIGGHGRAYLLAFRLWRRIKSFALSAEHLSISAQGPGKSIEVRIYRDA